LKATQSFTKIVPSVITVVGYSAAFFFLSVAIKYIPVGVAYGIWSGLGIVLISIAAYFLYGQALTVQQILGLGLIVAGVIVVNFKF
ncbi:multidrug efflux SMR transporter, partial [Arthrospira platensis SPKY1]|nr:multidrug efflux SMR transporter [Arthrospira platensis SPKY1]